MKAAYRLLILIGLLALPLALAACAGARDPSGPGTTPTPTPVPGGNVAQAMDGGVVQAYDQFAFRLLQELAAAEPGENVFISPTSVAFALAMVYNGADGETREAIAEALGVHGISMDALNESNAAWLAWLESDDSKVELSLANSIWMREGVPVLQDFLDRNQRYYHAEIEALDFDREDAADVINAWVSEQTRERIPTIIEGPIDPLTIMFLINALYFKGQWQVEFEEDQTRDRQFTLLDGSTRDVPMMHRTDEVLYQEADGLQAVSLPYGDGRFAMDVLLPERGTDVTDLVRRLDADMWRELTGGYAERKVDLGLPRFTLEYEASLNRALSTLGMGIAFDPHEADLTGIVTRESIGGENAYIKEVKHKTFLEVNEQGTEAAAVTSVEIGITSAPIIPEFIVDRPFVLAIRDTASGTILFIGAIVDPGE